ncbi:MAG: RsmE family RNA methyltransferase, partial [Candidatus Omnitrophota bacterium]|nr:RsmE family RNA methyltransferase [Candidatus Omnitrophota bacterium]
SYNMVIMPCLSGRRIDLKSALNKTNKPDKALVIIGPEGGFTEDEINKAGGKGAIFVSLGRFVLKSETAAIAAISMLNYECKF